MAKIDKSTVGYILGIVSIVFAFFTPLAGLILGIVGLTQSKKAKSEEGKKLNMIGIVLSAVLFIISIVLFIYSLSSGVNTGLPI